MAILMCGIAAIFAYSPDAPGVDRGELIAIRDRMTARGPDGAGDYISPDHRLALGHRRLAILDLSDAGAQPMWTADGRHAVVFNGEIYNYQALRSELVSKGHVFRSGTDTEVLLHLYAEHGPDMVHKLRGMYAFAIWDAQQRSLFLARDTFGVKPLYYADDGRTIRVASQVKALLQSQHIDTSPEPAGHVGFFLWGHVPDPFTLYRGIKALPAGHTLLVSMEHGARSAQPKEFCSISALLGQVSGSPLPAPRSSLAEYLRDTVAHHLIADVPVGVFQSAGLDSSTLTSYASDIHPDVRTVTLGFDEYRDHTADEVPLAEAVARHFGTTHRTVRITRQDFESSANALFDAMDRPSIDGVNTYFVSMAARQAGLKVALSGIGGDELFGGYPSFHDVPRLTRFLQPFGHLPRLGQAIRVVSSTAMRRFTSPKYAGLLEYGNTTGGAYLLRRGLFMPWELPHLLQPDFVREGWHRLNTLSSLALTIDSLSTDTLKVSALEMSCYMRNQLLYDADWAGMAHSLEIRVPFADVSLVRSLTSVRDASPFTKKDMAASAPRSLPPAVVNRPKTGFTVPVRDWLMQSFDPLAVRDRGLRGWAREVYSRFADGLALHRTTMRNRQARTFPAPHRLESTGASSVPLGDSPNGSPNQIRALVLLTDGFGGFGGIAKFNRDFLAALCVDSNISEVVALPRIMPHDPGPLPTKLTHDVSGLGGKGKYIRAVLRAANRLAGTGSRFPLNAPSSQFLIFCGHINLLPAAFLAQRICGGTIHLIIHGIDAWQPTRNPVANRLARRVDGFVSVSAVTKKRFMRWSGLRADQGVVLPNCVDLSAYSAGPKPAELLGRYRLDGCKVLMTLGRLASEERYKGFDEVLEILPGFAQSVPSIAYLVVGDGPDRPRLVAKAKSLGCEVSDFSAAISGDSPASRSPLPAPCSRPRVVFAGRIPDSEKADHYRLVDLYVMPSSGEGFGIVYLEALASGLPVIGSKADGSREALREGRLGVLVDPRNRDELASAVLDALQRNGRYVPPPANDTGYGYFSVENFQRRVSAIVQAILGKQPTECSALGDGPALADKPVSKL